MLKRLARLARDSVVYGSGTLLNQLIGFFLLPLYTRLLTPTDYGVVSMLGLVPIVFVSVATAGMKSAVYHRFNKCADDDERATMISTAQWSVAAGSVGLLAVSLLGFSLLERLLFGGPIAEKELLLTLASSFLASGAEIPRAALQSFNRSKAVAMLTVVQFAITTLTTIVAVAVLRAGVMGVVLGSLAGQAVATFGSNWLLRSLLKPRFSRPLWSVMAAYGRPYLPHRLLGIVLSVFADWVVRERLGLRETGLYGMAARFASPVGFLSGALLQAWQPYKFQVIHESASDRAFFASIFTYFVAAFGWLMVGLSVFGPELLRLMTADDYHAASGLVWMLVLSRILQGAYPLLATGVDVGDNTRQVPLASFTAALVMVPTTLVLSSYLGASGAALGGAAGWLTMAVAFYFISQRTFPIPYDLPAVLSLVAMVALAVGASVAIQGLSTISRLGIGAGIAAAFPIVVFVVLARSPAERERVQLVVGAVRRKIEKRFRPST